MVKIQTSFISHWMFNKHLKLRLSKTEIKTFLPRPAVPLMIGTSVTGVSVYSLSEARPFKVSPLLFFTAQGISQICSVFSFPWSLPNHRESYFSQLGFYQNLRNGPPSSNSSLILPAVLQQPSASSRGWFQDPPGTPKSQDTRVP